MKYQWPVRLKQIRVNRSNNGNANSHAPSSSSSSSNCHFSKQQKRELEKEKSSISTDSSVNSVSGVTTTNGGGGGTNSSSKLSKVRNNEKCSTTMHIFNSLPFSPKRNPIQTSRPKYKICFLQRVNIRCLNNVTPAFTQI